MSQPAPAERFHDLDALRAGMMFLGVVLHAAISFVWPLAPPWPAADADRSLVFTVLLFGIHGFRMQVFFLLAGFFGALLYARRGPRAFARHRAVRVLVPFLLAGLLIVPTLQAAWVVGFNRAAPDHLAAARKFGFDPDPYRVPPADFFLSGECVRQFFWYHLWFLEYLLVFYAVALPVVWLGGKMTSGRWLVRGAAAVVGSPVRAVLLAVPTALLLGPMRGWAGADTPDGFLPAWRLLVYYGSFFAVGWAVYHRSEVIRAAGRYWGVHLAVGAALAFPVMLFFAHRARGGGALPPAEAWAFRGASALFTWLMVFGSLGLARRFFARPRRAVRYLSDASYWAYLVHLTPVVFLQIALRDVSIPGPVKFALIVGAVTALVLASYELCVRRTVIGRVLNGRHRVSREAGRRT